MTTRSMQISVTMLIPTKGGMVWWPAEVDVPGHLDEVGAIDWINEAIVNDGTLRCMKIETEAGDGRARQIKRRVPVIIGINGFATITPLHIELIEAE